MYKTCLLSQTIIMWGNNFLDGWNTVICFQIITLPWNFKYTDHFCPSWCDAWYKHTQTHAHKKLSIKTWVYKYIYYNCNVVSGCWANMPLPMTEPFIGAINSCGIKDYKEVLQSRVLCGLGLGPANLHSWKNNFKLFGGKQRPKFSTIRRNKKSVMVLN